MAEATTIKRVTHGLVVAAAIICTAAAAVSVVQAAQFSKELTNPPDVMAGGVTGKVDLHLKNVTGIAVVSANRMAVYYPSSLAEIDENGNAKLATKSGVKLIIGKGRGSGYCKIPPNANGKIRVSFQGRRIFERDVTKTCGQFVGATITIPKNIELTRDEGSGYFRGDIDIEFTGASKRPSEMTGSSRGDSDGYTLNYILRLQDPNTNKSRLALRGDTGARDFGFRSSYRNNPAAAPNRQVKVGVVFGFPCEVDGSKVKPGDRTVKLYDPDKGFGETYIWVERDGRALNRNQYDESLHMNIESGNRAWDGANKRWRVEEDDRITAQVALKAARNVINDKAEYRLMVLNTGKTKGGGNSSLNPHTNTLSLSVPYDSIYGSDKCKYKLKPSVKPPNVKSVAKGTKIPVRGHIQVVDGADTDGHYWQLTARIYPDGKPSNQTGQSKTGKDPCGWRANDGMSRCQILLGPRLKENGFNGAFHRPADGNHNFSTNASDIQAGSAVCFVMSVTKPTHDSPESQYRHSAMNCVRIGGNATGTTVNDQTYSYYPELTVWSNIVNTGNYPKVDSFKGRDHKRNGYKWRLIEAKFRSKPTGTVGDAASKGGCEAVREKYESIMLPGAAACKVIKEGDNLFPTSGDPEGITAISSENGRKGPDPIGTWTCYTLSYRINPAPNSDLMQDIDNFASDWNDKNASSSEPSRWSDGRYRYWEPEKRDPETDEIIRAGYYVWVGDSVSAGDIKDEYRNASPSSPAKFKFTPYNNSCSVSGIDPKVQIRGGDLKVTGGISTSLRTMPVGEFTGDTFGSSAEYGVLSGGLNSAMASGSGLLAGSGSHNQDSWSTLTFANSTREFGRFSTMPPNSPEPEGATEVHADGYVQGAQRYTSGGTRIIKVTGAMTITGDLEYRDNNTYKKATKIPRIIFIADRINIAPSVERIDPWLVATEINTCNTIDPDGDDTSLTINDCDKPLQFNGPVYTNEIYLYRTGGSRIPKSKIRQAWREDATINPDADRGQGQYCENRSCGGAKYSLSAPAESFNLRPDIYLTSYAGVVTSKPVATTDMVTELPPRF